MLNSGHFSLYEVFDPMGKSANNFPMLKMALKVSEMAFFLSILHLKLIVFCTVLLRTNGTKPLFKVKCPFSRGRDP